MVEREDSRRFSKKQWIIIVLAFVFVLITAGILITKRQVTYSGVWKVKEYRIVQTGEIVSKEDISSYYSDRNYEFLNSCRIVLHKSGDIEIIFDDESLSMYGTYKVNNDKLFFYYSEDDALPVELDITRGIIEFDVHKNYGLDVIIILEKTA